MNKHPHSPLRLHVRPGFEALAALDAQLTDEVLTGVGQDVEAARADVRDFAVDALATTLRHAEGDPLRAEEIISAIDEMEMA